jgi:parvulin-like peptidyl-prolyl isomerase
VLPQPGAQPAVDPNAVAATVNGVAIPEMAVQRELERVPPAKRAEARPELLNFLIDLQLLEQYLTQSGLNPAPQDVESRFNEIKNEFVKQKRDLAEQLKRDRMTEAELKARITTELRWEKLVNSQATDAVLKQMFEGNKDMFDGSEVRARHILMTPPESDARAVEQAIATLKTYKQHVETQAAQAVARVPANADNLTREKARQQATEEVFALVAKERSACPTKERGGELPSFPRLGFMVEPFAKAAYALKPYEMSDIVKTPFGYHLILVVERKPGKEVSFDQVKEMVKDVYQDRLRENLIGQLRPKAKIVITPVK